MTSDPAVDAANRASRLWLEADTPMGELAAREMAKPIRELHRPRDPYGTGLIYCSSCAATKWPCPTSLLVYTTAELRDQMGELFRRTL